MEVEGSPENSLPSELKGKLTEFDSALSDLEKMIQPWLNVPESELQEKLSPLEKAKLDLVGAYTINSLFWMYLNVCGVNPKEHGVKQELDRIRSYMNRVKDVQDKMTIMPRLDQEAAKRFQRNALWTSAKSKVQQGAAESKEGVANTGSSRKVIIQDVSTSGETIPAKKRKTNDNGNEKKKKKKKNKDKK